MFMDSAGNFLRVGKWVDAGWKYDVGRIIYHLPICESCIILDCPPQYIIISHHFVINYL